jgi:ribonuclease Z
MTFSLTVLGSSSAIPTLNRNPSAHLLNANERLFLIDCAEGTQLQLRRQHIHFQRIRHILISHLHGDHYYGLIGLLTTFHLLGRKEELHLYGYSPLEEIIRIQLEVSATILQYPLHFHSIDPSRYERIYEDEKISIHTIPLKHSIPTCGFLFREKPRRQHLQDPPKPRSYAYCTDTAYDESILPYIKDVSLLYHEATFMHSMQKQAAEKMHSTTIEAATLAQKANAGKLLIGHYSARYDDLAPLVAEARSVFPETHPAEEGLILNI